MYFTVYSALFHTSVTSFPNDAGVSKCQFVFDQMFEWKPNI